jgi:hypothetical protein
MALNFYDKKWFVQALVDLFGCQICFNIMKDPVQCLTGHAFCHYCVSNQLDIQAKRCPICRVAMKKDRLVPSRIIYSLIEDSEVHCLTYWSTHGISVGCENGHNIIKNLGGNQEDRKWLLFKP